MAGGLGRIRLAIARLVAPVGYDIHNPDENACPFYRTVLEAAGAWELYPETDGRVRLDVTETARDAEQERWIELTTDHEDVPLYQLTEHGAAMLERLRGIEPADGREMVRAGA